MNKYVCRYCGTITDQNPCIKCGRRRPGRPKGTGTGNKRESFTPYPKPETIQWIKSQPDPYGVTIDKLVESEKRRRNE